MIDRRSKLNNFIFHISNPILAIMRNKFLSINSISQPVEIINPYSFDQPIAPHIASNSISNEILFSKIKENFILLQKECEYLFVEGAGGYKVPLTNNKSTAELISDLNIPIILVVGIRLGCINHTMLTVESINNHKHNPKDTEN